MVSPIRVDAVGSFRFDANIEDGNDACLLVGNLDSCEQADKQATEQALKALNGSKPAPALILTDVAWQMLYEPQPGAEIGVTQNNWGLMCRLPGDFRLDKSHPALIQALDYYFIHAGDLVF